MFRSVSELVLHVVIPVWSGLYFKIPVSLVFSVFTPSLFFAQLTLVLFFSPFSLPNFDLKGKETAVRFKEV